MAGLLSTPSYNDPRASILMGGGNSKITDDQIRAFVNANVNDPSRILDAALSNNISIGQYARAVGVPESQARAFITQQGINLNPSTPPPAPPPVATTPPPAAVTPPPPAAVTPPPVVVDKIEAPKPVTYNNVAPPPAVSFSPAAVSTTRVNPKTDTVQGQLQGILSDPNSPLMVAARTRGEQFANKRGLLNSSIGAESGNKAMIDSAMDIAAPDAATYSGTARENTAALNQGAMFNSQYGLLASQANAENAMKANMFNAENAMKANMFNADNSLKTGMFNADNLFRTNSFNSDLSSRLGMFNADTASKVGMFNAGTAADILNRREANATSILNNRESLASNQAIAKMDVDTKMSIAELQLRSEQLKFRGEETKLGVGIMDGLAGRISEIDARNIPMESKQRQIQDQIDIANNSLNLLESIQSSGVQQMLTGFKTSTASEQSGDNGAEGEKPVTANINGFPITKTDAEKINQLNQTHGTNFKPEQIVSQSEKQAIENDPVYQYDPKRYMRDNGIVEYTYIAKDGKQANYPDLLLWT